MPLVATDGHEHWQTLQQKKGLLGHLSRASKVAALRGGWNLIVSLVNFMLLFFETVRRTLEFSLHLWLINNRPSAETLTRLSSSLL